MRVDQAPSYLDLFSSPHRATSEISVPTQPAQAVPLRPGQDRALVKLEAGTDLPVPAGETRMPVPLEAPPPPADAEDDDLPLGELRRAYDVRAVSPRRMTDLAQDLYANGVLDWDEYSMLAYQPELQPDYDRTIGALTGEPADPDRPRDFVALWEDRLAFEERHNPADRPITRRSRHILGVLKSIDRPTNMLV